jgi:hypothetical protein
MNKVVYIKVDGSTTIRFNWPGDRPGDWSIYETKYPIRSSNGAIQLIEWLLDANGYTSILYSSDWEFVVIEEDHDN